MKCHCSTGQIAQGYVDPWTGQPLNFNFLPIVADPRLGVYPHTVQSYRYTPALYLLSFIYIIYRFDDPAPTYGNSNFTYMFNFLTEVTGTREVIYHGETDYWVVLLYLSLFIYDTYLFAEL